jgi:hypothetical protein
VIQKGSEAVRSTCTQLCETNEDCENANTGLARDGLCPSQFVCAVAAIAGAFRCKKMCVCKDDLVCGTNGDADGGVITPPSCPGFTGKVPTCTAAP